MGIKVHVDLNIMNHKFSEDQLRRGRLSMANDAQQAMEKYVPKKSGELRDHAKVATDGSSVYYVAAPARTPLPAHGSRAGGVRPLLPLSRRDAPAPCGELHLPRSVGPPASGRSRRLRPRSRHADPALHFRPRRKRSIVPYRQAPLRRPEGRRRSLRPS